MNNINKYTSLELSKKIYELAKKKGIELESECYWGQRNRPRDKCWLLLRKDEFSVNTCLWSDRIPAYDTSELGEIIPGNIDGYIFQMQKGMMGNRYFCSMSKMAGVKVKNERRHEVIEKTMAEAMGKMYFYLLDNNLL